MLQIRVGISMVPEFCSGIQPHPQNICALFNLARFLQLGLVNKGRDRDLVVPDDRHKLCGHILQLLDAEIRPVQRQVVKCNRYFLGRLEKVQCSPEATRGSGSNGQGERQGNSCRLEPRLTSPYDSESATNKLFYHPVKSLDLFSTSLHSTPSHSTSPHSTPSHSTSPHSAPLAGSFPQRCTLLFGAYHEVKPRPRGHTLLR